MAGLETGTAGMGAVAAVPAVDLAQITAMAAAHHLAVLGGFACDGEAGLPAGTRTVLMLGPAEPGYWAHVRAQPEWGGVDPVDRWSRRGVGGGGWGLGGEGRVAGGDGLRSGREGAVSLWRAALSSVLSMGAADGAGLGQPRAAAGAGGTGAYGQLSRGAGTETGDRGASGGGASL